MKAKVKYICRATFDDAHVPTGSIPFCLSNALILSALRVKINLSGRNCAQNRQFRERLPCCLAAADEHAKGAGAYADSRIGFRGAAAALRDCAVLSDLQKEKTRQGGFRLSDAVVYGRHDSL